MGFTYGAMCGIPNRSATLTVAVIAAALLAGPVWARDPATHASSSTHLPPDVILSDEFKLSRWAYPARAAKVRIAPNPRSRAIGTLRFTTEDGYPEIYLLLVQRWAANGEPWVRLRVPGRPNGRTGWVPRAALGSYRQVRTFLLVNRKTLRATLYRRGKRIFQARIGIGKPGTPTPAGRFYVREKFRVRGNGLYGVRAIGTSAYATLSDWPGSDIVGLHGTNKPHLIPGRPSHGCVRLRNRDVVRLYRLLPRGTPIEIR